MKSALKSLILVALLGAIVAIDNNDLGKEALGVNARLGREGYAYQFEEKDLPIFVDDEGNNTLVNTVPIEVSQPIEPVKVDAHNYRENVVPAAIRPANIGVNIPFQEDLEAKAVNIAQQAVPQPQEPYIPDDKLPEVQAPEEPEDVPDLVQPYVPEPAIPEHKTWESDPVMPDHNRIIQPPLTAAEQFAGWNGGYDIVATHDFTKFQNMYDLFAGADPRVPSHFPGFMLDTPVDASRLPVQSNPVVNDLDGVWLEGEEVVEAPKVAVPENAIFVPLTPEDLAKYPGLKAMIAKPMPVKKMPGRFVRIVPYNGKFRRSASVPTGEIVDLSRAGLSAENIPDSLYIVDGPFSNASKDPGVRFVAPSVPQKNSLLGHTERAQLPDASLQVGSA